MASNISNNNYVKASHTPLSGGTPHAQSESPLFFCRTSLANLGSYLSNREHGYCFRISKRFSNVLFPYNKIDVIIPGNKSFQYALSMLLSYKNQKCSANKIKIHNHNFKSEETVELIKLCPDLKELDLSFLEITDDGLKDIASYCKHLFTLNLSQCKKITDEGLKALIFYCKNLQFLNLNGCSETKDEGLKGIAPHCNNLQYLELSCCKMFTDKGLKDILLYCTNLQSLDLSFAQITDTGLKAIASYCTNLQFLDLSWCAKITAEGLKVILTHCKRLLILKLRGHKSITDEELKDTAPYTTNLQVLDLRWCDEITDEGIKAFGLITKATIIIK